MALADLLRKKKATVEDEFGESLDFNDPKEAGVVSEHAEEKKEDEDYLDYAKALQSDTVDEDDVYDSGPHKSDIDIDDEFESYQSPILAASRKVEAKPAKYEEDVEPEFKYQTYEEVSDFDTEPEIENYADSDTPDFSEEFTETHESQTDYIPDYTPQETEKEPISLDIYSQTLEHMITDILAQNQVKNVSLLAFGAHSKLYTPKSLKKIYYKNYTFVGLENTDTDLLRIFFLFEDMIREKEKNFGSSAKVVVKMVQPFTCNGIGYTTLLMTEDELSKYAAITGRKVAVNQTLVEEDLRVIIYGKDS